MKKITVRHTENLTTRKWDGRVQNMRKVVKDRMKQLPMTAYAVAKATGVKPQTISNFLTGNHAMRSDKLERVLAVLGLEIRAKEYP